MIIYVAWPTANVRRSNANVKRWQDAGYKVAVATDLAKGAIKHIDANVPPLLIEKYEGYYRCMNAMTQALVRTYKADVVICAGDGIHPHPGVKGHDIAIAFATKFPNGFGVLQPIGGGWRPTETGGGSQGFSQNRMHATAPSEERCESPWLGRKFIEEANSGEGPYAKSYDQYFGDHELHDVAKEMGCLWKNPVLHQKSDHWSGAGGPPILGYQWKNFERCYEKDLAMYRTRKLRCFPGEVVSDMGLGANAGRIIIP